MNCYEFSNQFLCSEDTREAASVFRDGGSHRTNTVRNSYGDHRTRIEDRKYIVIKVFARFPQVSLNTCLETLIL